MRAPSFISRILFSSPDFIIDKTGLAGLKEKQVVDAKVSKVLSDGKAQLIIKGETVTAKTHVLLKENEVVKLKVVSDGDTKILRLVKNDSGPVVPEGLKEMRAFGRSGLYSKLTKILSEYAPPENKPADVGPPTQSLLKKGEKIPQNIRVATSDFSAKINTEDLATLRSFINNKNVPLSQKIAAVIVRGQPEPAVVPQKLMENLVEKLFVATNNGKEPEPNRPVIPQLVESVKAFRKTLPVKSTVLFDRVADIKTLPFEYKLLSTLTVDRKVPFSEASTAVQKFLVKGLEQKGFNLTIDFPLAGTVEVIHTSGVSIKNAPTVKQLEMLLDNVSLNPEKVPDDESLKTIVRSSGLMWEARVKSAVESLKGSQQVPVNAEILVNDDIKALAMKLVSVMDGEDKNAANTMRSFVDGLEKMQLLNRQSFDESGRYLLPLPFFSDETLKFGQLLVDLDRDGSTSDAQQAKAVRVAFILEMSRLGNLKADFAIYKKSVSGIFGVENSEVQTLINGLLPELTETLSDKGYTVKKIGCDIISSGELAGASLTDMVLDNTDGLLNIVV